MKRGRPTLYNLSVIDKIKKYLSITGKDKKTLPTREGFAIYLGVNVDTVNEWSNRHSIFSDAIKEIDEKQKNQLIEDGLYGGKGVNSTMAIFLLKANHKMVETSHTDITTGGEQLKPFVVLDTKK